MSPLCPLDDEHLPLVVDSLKGKQVCTYDAFSAFAAMPVIITSPLSACAHYAAERAL